MHERNLALQAANENYKREKLQYELMATANTALRTWQHDNRNHLLTLSQMLTAGHYEECQAYLAKWTESIQNDADTIITTGNSTVDAILTVKLLEAKASGIPVSASVFLPDADVFPLENIECSSLLGNLLTNAIESASQTSAPFIRLTMKPAKGFLMIKIENSSVGDYKYDASGSLISTKQDGAHGLGLKRSADIIKKAGGFYEIKPEPDCFSISVLIPLKGKD